jgi:hypothetical protein
MCPFFLKSAKTVSRQVFCLHKENIAVAINYSQKSFNLLKVWWQDATLFVYF